MTRGSVSHVALHVGHGTHPTIKEGLIVPLVRIDRAAGKSAAYRAATSQGVYDAMPAAFDVPADDRFQAAVELFLKRIFR